MMGEFVERLKRGLSDGGEGGYSATLAPLVETLYNQIVHHHYEIGQ
jgi:hypothetical protein